MHADSPSRLSVCLSSACSLPCLPPCYHSVSFTKPGLSLGQANITLPLLKPELALKLAQLGFNVPTPEIGLKRAQFGAALPVPDVQLAQKAVNLTVPLPSVGLGQFGVNLTVPDIQLPRLEVNVSGMPHVSCRKGGREKRAACLAVLV